MDLKLKVLLDGADRLSAPFRTMKQSSDNLGAALKGAATKVRDLEKASASIEAFGRLKREAQANAGALALAQEKAQKLGHELALAGGGTKKAQAEFARARAEVNRLEAAQISITKETKILRDRLGEAGIDTRRMASAQRELKVNLDGARASAAAEAKTLDILKAKMQATAKARAQFEKSQNMQARLGLGGGAAYMTGRGIIERGAPMMEQAGEFEHSLAAYGLTAGQKGAELVQVRENLRMLSEQVNVSSLDMLEGQAILVGKGMKPEDAMASIGTIGKAVTGTGAQMADMAALAFSTMDNLKVPQAELAKSFDIMAKAGDEGGFELRDMATYFPQLTASAYQLGMEGSKSVASLSAALQIATKGAADPSEAANNMANFLKALTGKEAVKNFEGKGIDIKAAIQKGLMDGEDPVETMMKAVGQGIGIDLTKEMNTAMAEGLDPKAAAERVAGRFNLSELFGDAQAQNFIAPMLANMGKYREIRDAALNGGGTVDQKFLVMMKTYDETTKGLGIDVKNTWEGIGNTMLPVMTPLVNGLRGLVQGVGHFAAANPNLTRTVVLVTGALALLVAVGGALSMGIAAVIGPIAMMKFALATLGIQSAAAGGGLGLVTGGVRALTLAIAANPIGLLVTGLILAATLIYTYWEPIKEFFVRLWDGAGESFGGFVKLVLTGLQMILNPIQGLMSVLGNVMGDDIKAKISEVASAAQPMKVASTAAVAGAVAGPLAAAAAPAPTIQQGDSTYAISITAAPGQSETEIARQVRAEIERIERQKKTDARARLHDGEQ